MDRIEKRDEEVIDLGAATIETRGLPFSPGLDVIGDRAHPGMSHD